MFLHHLCFYLIYKKSLYVLCNYCVPSILYVSSFFLTKHLLCAFIHRGVLLSLSINIICHFGFYCVYTKLCSFLSNTSILLVSVFIVSILHYLYIWTLYFLLTLLLSFSSELCICLLFLGDTSTFVCGPFHMDRLWRGIKC